MSDQFKYLDHTIPNRLSLESLSNGHAPDVLRLNAVHLPNHVL